MSTMCKTPVPRLPLDSMVTTQNSSPYCQPLAGDSDRSCETHARLNYLPMDATSEHHSLPLPPFPSSFGTMNAGNHAQDPDPSIPQSSGFITPRGGLSLANLSLCSPQLAQGRSPHGTPYLSPKSPSMMSPIRMVGMRSSCSVKITGSCKRLNGSPSNITSSLRPLSARRVAHSPGKQKSTIASRALPFTEPTPAAIAAAAVVQDSLQRFQLPQLQGRELSFSDLLDPNVKHRRSMYHSTANLMKLPLGVPTPANATLAQPQNQPRGGGGAASSPPGTHTPATPSPASTLEGQMSPRKRPRKNAAPQRADFGGDSGDHGESSNSETSHGGAGAVAMAWEDDTAGHSGVHSALKIGRRH